MEGASDSVGIDDIARIIHRKTNTTSNDVQIIWENPPGTIYHKNWYESRICYGGA